MAVPDRPTGRTRRYARQFTGTSENRVSIERLPCCCSLGQLPYLDCVSPGSQIWEPNVRSSNEGRLLLSNCRRRFGVFPRCSRSPLFAQRAGVRLSLMGGGGWVWVRMNVGGGRRKTDRLSDRVWWCTRVQVDRRSSQLIWALQHSLITPVK